MPLSGNLVGRLEQALRDPDAARELAEYIGGVENTPAAYTLARTTDATDTTFVEPVPTLVEPSGVGVHTISDVSSDGATIQAIAVGNGTAAQSFSLRVILWTYAEVGGQRLWMPYNVAADEFVCTLSSTPAGDYKLVDSITNTNTAITSGSSGVRIVSGDVGMAALLIFSTYKAEKVQFLFEKISSAPTGMNAYFRMET